MPARESRTPQGSPNAWRARCVRPDPRSTSGPWLQREPTWMRRAARAAFSCSRSGHLELAILECDGPRRAAPWADALVEEAINLPRERKATLRILAASTPRTARVRSGRDEDRVDGATRRLVGALHRAAPPCLTGPHPRPARCSGTWTTARRVGASRSPIRLAPASPGSGRLRAVYETFVRDERRASEVAAGSARIAWAKASDTQLAVPTPRPWCGRDHEQQERREVGMPVLSLDDVDQHCLPGELEGERGGGMLRRTAPQVGGV